MELVKTGGKMSEEELVSEIRRADVVVGCGYCEPWGMRINDALLEGTPVIVSDGMGAAAVCDWYGCGCVVPKGNAVALAKVLKRCQEEPQFLSRLRSGAQAAAQELLPENRAKVFLNAVVSEKPSEVYEANGMIVVDQLLRKHGVIREDEVWVHGMWTPDKWWKCLKAKLTGKKLVRMTHGSLSPIYLEKQGKWKKRLVKPIEKICFALADRVVGTGAWEVEWARQWGLKQPIEVVDLRQFFKFDLDAVAARREALRCRAKDVPLKVLYLGREHPLKGTDALRKAVEGLCAELREVNDHSGEALERDWNWADVLVLPTLSENFGLVVAEALERGIPAITTDGAPAWGEGLELRVGSGGVGSEIWSGYGGQLIYLKGYRDGTDEERVELLKRAIERICE